MITINVRKSTRCNGDNSLYVSFPYDSNIVNIIRCQPTRYWNATTKEWELPYMSLDKLQAALKNYDVKVNNNLQAVQKTNNTLPVNFQFKTKPYEHQKYSLQYGINHDKWLLCDEQGLGKTKQVIDIAVAKKQLYGYKHCLIVCGVNGLKWNWLKEIELHSNETGYILGQRKKRNQIVIGSATDKLYDVEDIENIHDYFIITNVETLRNAEITAKLSKLCTDNIINMVAIDEIHKCKNPTSQQGKGILKLNAKDKIAMTGTPLMNAPLDLYIIMKWLGFEKHSFYAFKNHYCIMGGYGGYNIVGYKNMDELQQQVNSFMVRRLKKDVLDLPEKIYTDEFVDMTPKQSIVYKEIQANLRLNIDRIASSNNPLAEMIRLRQATGYTGIVSSTINESAKIDRLEEIVEETLSNNKKIVIFSNWTQITDVVVDRLSKNYNVLSITGNTNDTYRQQIVDTFQTDDNYKIIVGTIGAMGTGLTLTAGSVIVFMDEPWNMALKNQAIDRCHRIGTKSNVIVYTLLCKNTIDERVHELVENKGAMSDALIDGVVRKDKMELINYLLS